MNERLIWKGQLADLKQQSRELELEARALVASIRMQLNPHEPDITKIKAEEVENSADRLREIVEKLRHMRVQMQQLREDLGEDG